VEIQHYGSASLQAERRLAALFPFLQDQVPAARHAAIEVLVQQHDIVVGEALQGPPLLVASRRDRQGLGHPVH
jgi:hypothetical protein